ncbi:GUN4-like family protein [Lyngbya aestuarii BL J]|uniref:GUN4-like family protein n=2 Tax=Lyngbya aestuarii BL J TaxID=1348334 RepID=U7QPK7_9CYAN|nr:GUN4 domain-containing protein [Lyngbya aestuarii]ERT09040.1 GUN4-like family protein [Lyngbya aestuarii BL J]
MKHTNISEKTETIIRQIFKPLPIFVSGMLMGSIVTVYGTLTHVDLFNYLGSNNKDIIDFYSELLGFSNEYIQQQKEFRGYVEEINIIVNPNDLKLDALPNSFCENAIVEGDQIQISVPSDNPEQNRFEIFQEKIDKILKDGVGTLDIININNEPTAIEINLLTEKNTCIRKPLEIQELERLLQERKWKEADLKTYDVMLKVTNRKSEGYLNSESIQNFPCSYLETIDQLWTRYSGEQFGLSVQKEIYKQTGNKLTEDHLRKYDPDAYIHFNDLVRWIETGDDGKESWRLYEQLIFSLDAPQGHLPRLKKLEAGMEKEPSYQLISPNSLPLTSQEIQARNFLFSRVEACEL